MLATTFHNGGRLLCSRRVQSTLFLLSPCHIYYVFISCIDNLSLLIRLQSLLQYHRQSLANSRGLPHASWSGPYLANQVTKDFHGSLAFIVYDNKTRTVFAALVIFFQIFPILFYILVLTSIVEITCCLIISCFFPNEILLCYSACHAYSLVCDCSISINLVFTLRDQMFHWLCFTK